MENLRTPLNVMMTMAKQEIGNFVTTCMENNDIPSGIMVYILKDILLDIMSAEEQQQANEYVSLQKAFLEKETPEEPTKEIMVKPTKEG